jgi:gamma-glutamylputrescine oxidase
MDGLVWREVSDIRQPTADPGTGPSFWQLEAPARRYGALAGPASADVCIVGAGVTAASCAWRLLEHGVSVAVVEGREVAAGASGRNGGFASTGTALTYTELVDRLGADQAAALQLATEAALDQMQDLAGELRVPQAIRRTGSLWLATEDEAGEIPAMVAAAAGAGIRAQLAPERIPPPLRDTFVEAAYLPQDGELSPALWVRALVEAAAGRGARVFDCSPVASVTADGGGWRVATGGGGVTAQAVLIACDGLIPRLAPDLAGAIYPVRGQVAVTEVLPAQLRVLAVPTHSNGGFYYYRPTSDGRIAVGGGRMHDMEAEFTDVEATTATIQRAIDRFAARTLGLEGVRMEHRWAGIMGFSSDMLPLVGTVPGSDGLYISGGYSGVGNVQGFLGGRIAADLIATGSHPQAAAYDPARPLPAGRADERMAGRPDS